MQSDQPQTLSSGPAQKHSAQIKASHYLELRRPRRARLDRPEKRLGVQVKLWRLSERHSTAQGTASDEAHARSKLASGGRSVLVLSSLVVHPCATYQVRLHSRYCPLIVVDKDNPPQ